MYILPKSKPLSSKTLFFHFSCDTVMKSSKNKLTEVTFSCSLYPQSFSILLVKSHQLGHIFIFLCPRIIESMGISGGHHLSSRWSPIFYMKALRRHRDRFEVTCRDTLKAGMVLRLILLVYLSC